MQEGRILKQQFSCIPFTLVQNDLHSQWSTPWVCAHRPWGPAHTIELVTTLGADVAYSCVCVHLQDYKTICKVLLAVNIMIMVSWAVTPCCLVHRYYSKIAWSQKVPSQYRYLHTIHYNWHCTSTLQYVEQCIIMKCFQSTEAILNSETLLSSA